MLTSYCHILCRERLPLNYRCKSMTWLSNKISAYYLDVFQSQGVAYVNCILFMVFYLMKLINWYEHAMGGLCLMHSGIYCLHCLLYPSVGVWWNYPFFKGAHNICMCNLESTSQCYANSNRMWWRCQSLWHSIQRVSDAATYVWPTVDCLDSVPNHKWEYWISFQAYRKSCVHCSTTDLAGNVLIFAFVQHIYFYCHNKTILINFGLVSFPLHERLIWEWFVAV